MVISVGGQNGNWAYVFASESSISKFVESLVTIVLKFHLNGVDLDIESYLAPPKTVANTIQKLKQTLNSRVGRNLLIVSPEDVAIYQGSPMPNPDAGGQPFNYFVPIVQLADQYIDIYQPQAYNNWYDGFPGGSLEYFNWRNLQGLSPWTKPLENFKGIAANKLRIGLLASASAGQALPACALQHADSGDGLFTAVSTFGIWHAVHAAGASGDRITHRHLAGRRGRRFTQFCPSLASV